jgi:hypothetical protein
MRQFLLIANRINEFVDRRHIKFLSGDFSAKVGGEEILKPTIGNESLHEISNDINISAKQSLGS